MDQGSAANTNISTLSGMVHRRRGVRFDVPDMIDLTEAQEAVAISVPTPLVASQAKRTRLSKVEKAFADLMLDRIDLIAYGWTECNRYGQVSCKELNRHYDAVFAMTSGGVPNRRHLRSKLCGPDLARSLRGQRQLHVRSRWHSRFLLVRFDVDQHEGQTDGVALLGWLASLLEGDLYTCPTARGWSGYCWVEIAMLQMPDGKEVPAENRKRMNRRVSDLNRTLVSLSRREGFRATVEVKGGFVQTTAEYCKETGMPLTPRRLNGPLCSMARLPHVTTFADVDRLRQSVVGVGALDRLIGLTKPAADEAQARCQELLENWHKPDDDDDKDDAPAKPAKVRRSARKPLVDTGCIMENSNAVLGRTKQELGLSPNDDSPSLREAVKERANKLYVDVGFGDTNFDEKRSKRFDDCLKFLMRTHDKGRRGKGGREKLWWTEEDRVHVETRLRSTICGATLKEINAELGARRLPAIDWT